MWHAPAVHFKGSGFYNTDYGTRKRQREKKAAAEKGFTAVKHQREVGTSYFDAVATAISQGKAATTAMSGSTEAAQFH